LFKVNRKNFSAKSKPAISLGHPVEVGGKNEMALFSRTINILLGKNFSIVRQTVSRQAFNKVIMGLSSLGSLVYMLKKLGQSVDRNSGTSNVGGIVFEIFTSRKTFLLQAFATG
jgi:hypothetical protein